ncbi:Methylthioribulose-1-phosphate dehydratase [Penicillium cf. griseofulvum]|uniref:Methylthioribulose-1-phosphate dehydratase n=1 Tax=Penicillium cf. griseofulvum TaxID=2972120 RepID=A0A9W9MRR8_9EURO|nr:Methylthioribulose-1-phosphate dehydratase [Penicillium cf. griseofulvum]KAJ5440728.1 Methylthioribulose-1-phosphate dehydratase [Penicillium cf. griseofulvum]
MAGSCSYDCSLPGSPSTGTSDSDITGIGVIANYIATAGLSILVITIYYCFVYDPSQDPFDNVRGKTILSQSNPVDDFILGGLRSSARYVFKHLFGFDQMGPRANCVYSARTLVSLFYTPVIPTDAEAKSVSS